MTFCFGNQCDSFENISEILLSDIYRIARKISKNDEDMVKILAI